MQMKEIDKSLDEYLICLRLNPASKEAKARIAIIYYKYAIVSFNNKEYEECVKNSNLAIDYHNSVSEFYVIRARAYLKINNLKKGYEDIKTALKLDPNNKQAIEMKKYLSN
jgi:tetratricopeptide (TPR) repeat protein